MKNTRRDIFKFAGGAAAGALLTPVPWRLIKDSSLWSENWPGIPRPARGEIRSKTTNCALCPAGCPLRARCVGDQPVALTGAGCAFGVAAHHLPYHPARLRQGPVEQAKAALAKRTPSEPIAVLDLNPGRTASWTFRRAMAALDGTYISPDPNPIAYDLHSVRTVLSVGAPLLEGWGTPANVLAAREKFYLVHAGAVETPTAMLADEWIRAEGLPDPLPRRLLENGPSLAVGDAPGVAELNRKLGAPVYTRPEAPVPDAWKKQAAPVTALDAVPARGLRFLLIDESSAVTYIPWHLIEPKLASDAVVITFAVSRGGYARHATYALPAPVFPEITEDIPAAIDQTTQVFRLAAPLVPPPPAVVNASELVAALADIPAAAALRERADFIHMQSPAHPTPDAFWQALVDGYIWRGSPSLPAQSSPTQPRPAHDLPLTAVPAPWTPALLSPLMTKLYEESNLRLPPNAVALNPRDAAALPSRAVLQTLHGKCTVRVVPDASVPPGIVLAGSSPGIRDICTHGDGAKVVLA